MTAPLEHLRVALGERYRIERELGAGGMATVYLACDLKHDREVAIKVLRPELGALLGAERFLSEIRIAARLDHPHILTLIDSGAADGTLYYVLPFVRGESLRDRLDREKQLGVDDAIAITRQVAGALEYAHRQGVIHRDIKPENILLQEGEAILADFGIALAVKEAGGSRLTETGLSLGTPQYMSPEQATGDRTPDPRSDVYSLAAVLYEMLAGEPPITGPSVQAMIAKLLTEPPTRLRVVRGTVPASVDAAVAKALAKTPADRFAGMTQFAAALTDPSAAGAPADRVPVRRLRPWLIGAAAVLAVAATGWALRRIATGTFVSPLASAVPVQLTSSGRAYFGVPSPDGTLLAYMEERCEQDSGCRGDLLIRETAGEGITTLVSQPGQRAKPLRWSPDGRWVLFYNEGRQDGWYIVSQRGGQPRRISGMGPLENLGFVAPDTIVMTGSEGPSHWLARFDVATGRLTDSVLLETGGLVGFLLPSPDGSRLLAAQIELVTSDSASLIVFNRRGLATATIRVAAVGSRSVLMSAVWSGSNAVILGMSMDNPNGLVAVRYRLDRHGQVLPRADTLTMLPDGQIRLWWASADASQLYYDMARSGETSYWTATRDDIRGPFTKERRVAASTAGLGAAFSPQGGWIGLASTSGSLGTRWRVEAQSFDGRERHVLESSMDGIQNAAFSPADDSLMVAAQGATGPLTFAAYGLPAGPAVPWHSFDRVGRLGDLGWLVDGRMAAPIDSGRVIRVFARNGDVRDYRVPDSLGVALFIRPSPTSAELVVGSRSTADSLQFLVWRMNLLDGRVAVLARSSTLQPYFAGSGGAVWSSDGEVRLELLDFYSAGNVAAASSQPPALYRVSTAGGLFVAEPASGLEAGSHVEGLSRDARRALVREQRTSSDLWVLRARPPR